MKTVDERYWEKVDVSAGPDACWPWTASVTSTGYGQFWDGTRNMPAHRYALGVVPRNLDVDHTCHNSSGCPGGPACLHRRCQNPAHLEAVTHQVNAARGQTGRAASGSRAWKTECIHGHAYTPENQYIDRNGHQLCRACNRDRQRRLREERNA